MERLQKLKEACLREKGNDAAIRTFFIELQRCIYFTINQKKLRSLPNEQMEEIVQNVLMAVYKQLDSVDNVLLYAQKILFKMFFTAVRKREKEALLFNKEIEENDNDEFSQRFKELEESPLEELKAVISGLKPPNNILLSARFFEKRRHKDLSEELGIPINQIGVRMNRAMNHFMKTLKKEHEGLLHELSDYFDREIDQ
jgi:RNA polymerase sigma factor (sigma-70 family)